MRVFFGIEPAPATAEAIADWRDRQFARAGRPIPVANLHMTLAFAGELSKAATDALCAAAEKWISTTRLQGAALVLDQTGYWPGPGVYWLGPGSWPNSLQTQAHKLRDLVACVGARRERKSFQPHVTLFRNCRQMPPPPAEAPAITLSYRQISLYESRQVHGVVTYHVLQSWPLRSG